MQNLLLVTVFLPVLGAGVVSLLAPRGRAVVRQTALATAAINLVLALWLVVQYGIDASFATPYALSEFDWFGTSGTFTAKPATSARKISSCK